MTIPYPVASETHLTLSPMHAVTVQRIQAWAESVALKWTIIELSTGEHPFQPMLTRGGTG